MQRLFAPGRYANVTATLALIVALTGSAYAATKIHSKDIADGQVRRADLARNAVNSTKVKNRSLRAKDFKKNSLPAGARGATGATGAPGARGAAGPAGLKGDTGPVGATTPVAVFKISDDGTVLSAGYRAPVTSAPIVTHVAVGAYNVTLPGLIFSSADAAVCSPANYFTFLSPDYVDGKISVSAFYAGERHDTEFSCAIYRLSN